MTLNKKKGFVSEPFLRKNKMASATVDVERVLSEAKLCPSHIQVIALCFLAIFIDGFDVNMAGFAGPGLMKQFHVPPAALGTFFSAGLIAGLLGTPLFGILADRFGRRWVIILGMVFFGITTLVVLAASSFLEIVILRFLAGVALAGVMPTIVALASEYAPRRFRARMVTVMFTGQTLGGVATGLVAAKFAQSFGWQILFLVAGLAPLAVALVLIFLLPDSVHYLIRFPRHRAELIKIVKCYDSRLDIGDQTRLVTARDDVQVPMKISALFAGRLRFLTPLIWLANIMSIMVLYFGSSWLPTIFASAGGPTQAAFAGSLFLLGGTLGGLGIMWPLDRVGFLPIPVLFFLSVPALIAVGMPGLHLGTLFVTIAIAGFCLYAVQFGLIAMEGPLFPPPIRGRGLGFCFAAARIGATIGPIVGGILIGRHLPIQTLFIIFTIPLVIGGIVTSVIAIFYHKQINLTSKTTVPMSELAVHV
jgi:MFS transporter, AAHS family, 4-hydroxybenzoate transporter